MSRRDRKLERYVDSILRDHRPSTSDAGEDAAAMQLAARLHAAHPGSAEPAPQFVDALARRMQRASEGDAVQSPQRRQFLAAAGLAAAAGVGAGIGVEHWRTALTQPASNNSGGQQPIVPADGEWVAVTTLAALTPGAIQRFSAGGIEGFVLNAGGRLRALSAVCTDQGCLLTADTARERLVCPCHWATFQLDGHPTPGTAYESEVTPLPTVSVRANGEDVEVLVPKLA